VDLIHREQAMNQSIASKLSAVAIAVILNAVILGGVCYMFALQSDAAPTSAQCQSEATLEQAGIV
jgi:hypothetical protein